MAKKKRENSPDYDIDFLKSYLDAFVQDSVALPAPIQDELAKVVSQAYAGGQRGTNADIASLPFPTSSLIKNPDLVPQTIGDAERLLARSFYPAILQTAQVRSEGKLGVDPLELISTGVERVMDAAKKYDPSKGGFGNFAGNQIFGAVTGGARDAVKPQQGEGTEAYWYNQLRTSIGENVVQTQFYTPGGTPLIGADGRLNTGAVIPLVDAGLDASYMPAYLTGTDLDRYAIAKEGGLISNDPSVKRVESGLRKLNSNLLGGRGEGDNSFIGANSQEADAVNAMLPDRHASAEDTLDALFHRETNDFVDATAAARLRHANGGRPVFGTYENDSEVTNNRMIYKTASMSQQVDLDERSAALAAARQQLEEQAESVPQVAYQTQEMQERLTLGKVRSGFKNRFQQDNPELVPLSKKQFGVARDRVREFERPEQVIPAQPIRVPRPVSDVGQSVEPQATLVEPVTSPAAGPQRSDYGSLSEYTQARSAWLGGQESNTGEAAASAATPDGPASSSGNSGSGGPPEEPPFNDEPPMSDDWFPQPRRNAPTGRQHATLPPHGYEGTLGEWFTERAGLGRVPTDKEAQSALNLLNKGAPAYGDMFMGQWAKPDPAFDKFYEVMSPDLKKAWNTAMANHHSKPEGTSSPYKDAVFANPEAAERWKQSARLEKGEITLDEFNEKWGTRGNDPSIYQMQRGPTSPSAPNDRSLWQKHAGVVEASSSAANVAPVDSAGAQPDSSGATPKRSQPSSQVLGADGDVDSDFVPGSNWDKARANIEANRDSKLAEEYQWTPGSVVHDGNIEFMKTTARTLNHKTLGGARSSKLGEYNQLRDAKGSVVGGEYRLGDKVSASAEEVNTGLQLARDSATGALGQGDLVGMDGISAAATFNERFNKILNGKLNQLEKDVVDKGGDPVAAKEFTKRIQEIAQDATEHMTDGWRQQTGFSGRPGDFQYKAARLTAKETQMAAVADPAFREHLSRSAGSVEDAVVGPPGVYAAEGRSLRYGDPYYSSGRGGGGRGSGGRQSGSFTDDDDHGPFEQSPYQSSLGRFMMTQFMMSMAWQNTGGQVLASADQYGSSQSYLSGMTAFGNGGASGGAPGYAARMAVSNERAGEVAYNQYGMFNELGANLKGGPFASFGNDAMVAGGVGLTTGILASGLGLSAGPIGLAAAGVAAIPAASMSVGNYLTDRNSLEGYSPRNWMRAELIQGALENKVGWNDDDRNFMFSNPLSFMTSGDQIDQFMETRDVDEATVLGRSDWGAFIEKVAPGTLKSIAVSDAERDATKLSEFNRGIASKFQVDPEQSAKILASLQVGMGGLENDVQKEIAEKMVGSSLDTGKDQLGLYSQYASLRGVAEGSREWQGGAHDWVNTETEEERVALLRKQTKMSQAYSQVSPYLEGGTRAAAQLADNFGIGHMATAQAFAQVAFGFGMDNGRDMTDLEATGFAQVMQGQSPRVNMKLAGIANQVAGLGAGNMTDTFGTLSGAVAGGMDANFLGELFSGNQYALSDWGREIGQGNLQYFQEDGRRMGTSDISGVTLGAQQRMGLPSSFTASQTLDAMGLTFSSMDARNSLINGGLEGYQAFHSNQMYGLQMASMGVQGAQIAANERYMYKTWDIEDRIDKQQFGSQMEQFDFSLERMDLQHKFQQENWAAQDQQRDASNDNNRWRMGFDYQTSLMQRDFTREGWDHQSQMQGLSFGWSMEDADEAIRRSSGYERAQLIKRRDREVTTQNLTSENTDRVRGNQEQLWEREDERYRRSLAYTEDMIALEEDNTARQRAQYEELFQMDRANTVRRKEDAEEMHKLQMEMQKAQREHQEEQIAFSKASLGIQMEQARQQHEYSENVRKFNESREKDEAAMRKLIGYQPSFARMIQDWIQLIERHQNSPVASVLNPQYSDVNRFKK